MASTPDGSGVDHERLTARYRYDDPHRYGRSLDAWLCGAISGLAVGAGLRGGRVRTRLALGVASALLVRSWLGAHWRRIGFAQHQRVAAPTRIGSVQVVVPVYNTGRAVVGVLEEIYAALAEWLDHDPRRILAVDDGSSAASRTNEWLRTTDVRVVTLPHNQGKGAAIRVGLALTDADAVLLLDGDGAYDPMLAWNLLANLSQDAVVVGRRRRGAGDGRDTWVRAVGSWFFRGLQRRVLLGRYEDTQAGIKALRGEVAREYARMGRVNRFAYDVELLALCETRGWSVGEVEVAPQDTGASTVRLRSALRTCYDIARIRWWQRRGVYAPQ